jgi:3-oxoacyl-ACP reductase-like protein
MSILGSIVSAIFHHAGAASTAQAAPSTAAPSTAAPSASAAPTASPTASAPSTPAMPPKPATPVDVEAVLTKLAAQNKEKLDWRKSIVDLMKLLNLDSSLTARKQLASELHYSGDQNDSATMNIWLHQQVMQKLAENGGKVPDELLRK